MKLAISRAAFTGGENIAKYLSAFNVDLFLSKNEIDDQDSHVKPASEEIPSGRVPYKSDSKLSEK